MNITGSIRKAGLVAGVTAFTLFASPLVIQGLTDAGMARAGIFNEAFADEAASEGQKGAMGTQRGGQGQQGAGGHKGEGAAKGMSKVLESDDDSDSDRPEWAMGNKELNPHRGDSNPTPGVRKGDEYGDLWVYVRDPVTGLPVTVDCDAGTCYQVVVCADPACTTTELYQLSTDPEAELPEGVTPVEVELGRLNIGRAPTKVIDHAADEALSKITADDAVLGLDAAGRITVNGVTIDSPLENLALYVAIMSGDAKTLAALEPLLADNTVLELAAALLAGAADKTGEITTDVVFYSNTIFDLVPNSQDYVDYSTFSYDRTAYDTLVAYHYYDTDGTTVLSGSVNLMDYLTATQPALPDASGIVLFSVAADDALEVIELLHTQIHDAVLPGTVTP